MNLKGYCKRILDCCWLSPCHSFRGLALGRLFCSFAFMVPGVTFFYVLFFFIFSGIFPFLYCFFSWLKASKQIDRVKAQVSDIQLSKICCDRDGVCIGSVIRGTCYFLLMQSRKRAHAYILRNICCESYQPKFWSCSEVSQQISAQSNEGSSINHSIVYFLKVFLILQKIAHLYRWLHVKLYVLSFVAFITTRIIHDLEKKRN